MTSLLSIASGYTVWRPGRSIPSNAGTRYIPKEWERGRPRSQYVLRACSGRNRLFNLAEIDFLHLHHRGHHSIGCRGIAQQFEYLDRTNLPRQSVLIFQPATDNFLATVAA